jgi:hypothetical protein
MGMRELPFGARISDSFVKKLKWETTKANEEWSGVLPCLCVEEKRRYETLGGKQPEARPMNLFQQPPETSPVNRLVPPTPPPGMLIKERSWVLCFDKRKHPPEATFEVDGLELHISERAQAELKGATLRVVNDKIVVTYEPI